MSKHTLKTLVKKRSSHPLFRYYGKITESSIHTLVTNFDEYSQTTDSAKHLREALVSKDKQENYHTIEHYNQYDIQTCNHGDEITEDNFKIVPIIMQPVYDEISYMLNSPVCRMRYATLDVKQKLPYHIDQPGNDRFIVVLKGEQVINIRTKTDTIQRLMLPGEVWYINSNWDHQVTNIGNRQRLAMLGCFTYND